ncbi:MAG: glycosyltransferase [Halomonas sp.]|uniref:glycosyltransferase n=1 Tax=Halomonas sp. TaxID=1486246 RepID=UPI002ACE57F3|nr:glycosyltransferase [Halomonas sp.]MDZ7851452.1 glycosyltransferase [Halomonas sp.]
MRTLVVVRTLKIGGMERVAVNLADAFAAQGHESHLMTFKARPPHLSPQDARVHVHHFALSRAMWRSGLGGAVDIAARIGNAVVRKSHFLIAGWWGGRLFQRELNRLEQRHGRFDRIIFRGMGTFEAIWSFRDPRACYVLENILKMNGQRDRLARLKARCLFHGKHLVTVSTGVERQVDATLRSSASFPPPCVPSPTPALSSISAAPPRQTLRHRHTLPICLTWRAWYRRRITACCCRPMRLCGPPCPW